MLKEPCAVTLHTDSAYVYNAFAKGWLDNWQANGWKKADKKPVENQDLWKKMLKRCGAKPHHMAEGEGAFGQQI